MEVELISSFYIKPSRPTPQHLKIHNLSLLDQYVTPTYSPLILLYTADNREYTLTRKLQLLRQSLSETLTYFYPFAGTIKDRLSIDCNDIGIHYSEAKSNSSLTSIFKQPNLSSSLRKLLPSTQSSEGAQVALIRVTSFACGGLAIGLNVSHMIADGYTASFFFNTWGGAAARKAIDHYACPNFEAPPTIFPQRADVLQEGTGFIAHYGPSLKTSKIATRRLGFGPAAIAKLRAEGYSSCVPNPTRVEVVSALIWKCIMAAMKANYVLVTHAIDIRRKALPAFPASYMGNFTWAACSSSATLSNRAVEEGEEKDVGTELLPNLVIKLREAITKVNSDLMKSLQGEGGWARFCEALREMAEEASGHGAFLRYSSLCGSGFYNVDFGWGKPAWATSTGFTEAETVYYNTVFLFDTPSGDAVEALVFLQENDMAILERDPELLALATLDPNPLQLNARL